MAKSLRSKWKKMHRRAKATEQAKHVNDRIKKLNGKLRLVANGGIRDVPHEEPERRFHFSAPPTLRPGQRASLTPMTTNPYGKSDPTAPHPSTVNYESLEGWVPKGGTAMTMETMQKAAEAEKKKRRQQATSNDDDNDDDSANDISQMVQVTVGTAEGDDDDDDDEDEADDMQEAEEGLSTSRSSSSSSKPAKIKSMQVDTKKVTSGTRKMQPEGGKKRLSKAAPAAKKTGGGKKK